MPEKKIEVQNITIAYDGAAVIRSLTFAVDAGDYLCVVGENGSGKSTLVKALVGVLKPQSGEIRRYCPIGYLPQQSEIQRDFPASVWEVVLSGNLMREGFRLGFGYGAASRKRAEEAMRRLDILPLRDRSYNTLSGGQQQRVLLSRALCASEELLILDEPVTGLDPEATRDMYACIRNLHREGCAILTVTHDVEAALDEAEHILCLCQRHPAPGTHAAPFYGTADAYRAFLEHGCDCHGTHDTL